MSSGIAGYIGGLFAVALVGYLAAAASKSGTTLVEGRKTLFYGSRVRLVGWVLLAITAPLAIYFFLAAWYVPASSLAAVVGIAILLLPLALLLEFYGVSIGFDSQSIHTHSPWRKARQISWSEIVSCRYSTANHWHVIGTRTQGNIRISDLLLGSGEFLSELRRRCRVG